MARRKSRARQLVEYAIVRIVIALLGVLPLAVSFRITQAFTSLYYALDLRHREIALANLSLVFPEKTESEREEIARASYRSLGWMVAEMAKFRTLTPENVSRLVTYDDGVLEIFEGLLERGKGVFLLTGHFGNWELLAYAHALNGHPVDIVSRPLDNPFIERYLGRMRMRSGNRLIASRRSAQNIAEALRRNSCVGVLFDQHARLSRGVEVPFFGVRASTTAGVATIARRTGAAVLPAFIVRLGPRALHRIVVGKEVPVLRTSNMERDIEEATARFNVALEEMIRRYPDHWFWVHRRWKKSPDQPNLYKKEASRR